MPSTLLVPLRSLSFQTLDLWTAGSEDHQRCQLSTSPWSILEKSGTSKWSSYHPCPEPWWTAWLSRAWCVVVGRVFSLCPPEGCWWRSFLTRHQFFPQRPVFLHVMLSTVPTIPHAQKTWVLGETRLLSQQKVHHLQVNKNKPLMLIITNFLQHILHCFILLF